MRLDEIGELHRRLVAGGGVARELRKPMGQIGMVHVREVVPGGRKLLRVRMSHIAKWIEPIGDEDRRRQVGMRRSVQGGDVGLASIIGVLDVIAHHLVDAVGLEIEPGPVLAPRQRVAREGSLRKERLFRLLKAPKQVAAGLRRPTSHGLRVVHMVLTGYNDGLIKPSLFAQEYVSC